MPMDLNLLHIKLTAYALGELDAVQKAEIERILSESQDARDQVMYIKTVAKTVKDMLPQTVDDVEPMTPAEYLLRRNAPHAVAAQVAPASAKWATAAAPAVPAPAPGGGNALAWVLALLCIGLSIGLITNWKTAQPAPASPEAGAVHALAGQLAASQKNAAAAAEALRQAQEEQNILAAKLEESEDDAANLQASLDALETARKTDEAARLGLGRAWARAQSAAQTNHQPFVAAGAQVFSVLTPSASSGTQAALGKSLAGGAVPLPGQVDVSELVQSLKYNRISPPPGQSAPLVSATAAACPWAPDHVLACVSVTTGTVDAAISSLMVEFNPVQVGSWRMIGRENKVAGGSVAGGQGTGLLTAGGSLTVLYEIIPAADPLASLSAKRALLLNQIAEAKRTMAAASNVNAQAEAQLNTENLGLDLQDIDNKITEAKITQAKRRYSAPAAPTAEAAQGDWLAVTVVTREQTGKISTLPAVLTGSIKPFPDADADFRLAAAAAALGLALRESPARGTADLSLVASMLKDLPPAQDGVKTLQNWVAQIEAAGKPAGN